MTRIMVKASRPSWDRIFCTAWPQIRLELNVCKRSDTGLHDFGLLCRSGSFDECLHQARAVLNAQGEPDIWLCVDNARRQQINEYVNRALAPEDATKLEAVDGTILLYEGANLIATKTIYGVTNAIWYTVTKVADHLHLLSERGEEVFLSLEQAGKCLTLRHAMTIHKSQSRTLQGHVRICTGSCPGHVSPFFTLRHLLVAASRATARELLSIE